VLTDPSYAGQIVTMTAPLIGNYGVAQGDAESQAPHVAGFVMREASPLASNWRADGTLRDYLVKYNIVAIADIDTRALTRVLRSAGCHARRHRDRTGRPRRARAEGASHPADGKGRISCAASRAARRSSGATGRRRPATRISGVRPRRRRDGASKRLRVAAYDFGVKFNILRRLDAYGATSRVFRPIRRLRFAAIDPTGSSEQRSRDPPRCRTAIENVRALTNSAVPMFGICLGTRSSASPWAGRRSS
jgi:carbamoyl-phosphate synthase small subunit